MMAYVADNDEGYPRFAWNRIPSPTPDMALDCPSDGYDAVLRPYLKSWDVYACPSQRFFPTWGTNSKMVTARPGPDSPTKGRTSYGYNWTLVNLSLVMTNAPKDGRLRSRLLKDPVGTIFLAENEDGQHITYEPVTFNGKPTGAPNSTGYQNLANDPEVMKRLKVSPRHFGKNNYIFADGHVRALAYAATKVPNNMWSFRADD
jgi:prepilin-type processing-associated H-X9-DG protein